jgi:hypothetical protein
MTITDSMSGAVVYHDSAVVDYLLPGERRDVRLPTWNAAAGWYRCAAWTRLEADVNRSNDSGRVRVKVSWGEIGWQQRPDVPGGIAPVKHGAALARMQDAGHIYALKGNKTGEFYVYSPAAAAWTTLPSLPPGPSGRPVNKSADLCSDDSRYLYALKGNRTCEFWRYDTRDRIWEQMFDVPAGASAPRAGSGLACVTRGDSVLVFCLKASNTFEFYRYDAGSNQWLDRASAPAGPLLKKFKNGSALCAGSGERLFAVKSKVNEFYCYDIAADNWTPAAGVPLYAGSGKRSSCRDGCDLAATGDGTIYAFAGGNREYFFGYDVASDNWAEFAALPLGPSGKKVKAGGALAVLGKQCWALKGNRTCEFWVYTPDTMAFSPPRPGRSGVSSAPAAAPAQEFTVHPRICRDRVNVRYSPSSARHSLTARVTLLSPLGRAVTQQTVRSGSWATLDMVHLPAGTYFLRLETPAAVRTEKLVLQD